MRGKTSDVTFTVSRKDLIQIETDSDQGVRTEKVKWVGECEYELTLQSKTGKETDTYYKNKELIDSIRKIPSRVTILATGQDYYVLK